MAPNPQFAIIRTWGRFEWAPLPTEIDLPRYEEIQQEWNQRDCPNGVMSRLWRLLSP